MKRVVMSFAAIAVVSTVVSAGPSFEITPMVGKKIYNDDKPRFDDSEVLYGVRGNVYVTENISAQVGFEASTENGIRTDLSDPSVPGDTDLQRYSLNAQYDIPTATKVTPYVFAGGGYEKISHEYEPENIESQPFVDAGVGLRYALTDKVDIVTEVRGIHKTSDKDDDILGGVGVGFKFGGSPTYSQPAQNRPKAMTMQELAELAKKSEERNVPVKMSAPIVVNTPPTEVQIPMAKTYPMEDSRVVSPVVNNSAAVPDNIEISSEIVYDSDESVNVCNVMGGGTPYVDVDYLEERRSISTTPAVEDIHFEDNIQSEAVSSSRLSGYFIQVVALSKSSPDRMVAKLKSKGYPVVLKKTKRLTKVLVGPYSNRSVAAKSLMKIKRIQGDAFIYRKK